MTITREQVQDLQPGDVVELSCTAWSAGTVIRGPVWIGSLSQAPHIGPIDLATPWGEHATLTVVSRAPRPLYVNHPRTEPAHGDIVRDDLGDAWQNKGGGRWYLCGGRIGVNDIREHAPLTLLWNGETGQAVQ